MTSNCRQLKRKLMSSRRVMWTNQDCLELIDLYRQKPELWDPDDPRYTHRLAKIAAWKYISSYFLCRVDETKLRLESLRRKYMEERCKEGKTIVSLILTFGCTLLYLVTA